MRRGRVELFECEDTADDRMGHLVHPPHAAFSQKALHLVWADAFYGASMGGFSADAARGLPEARPS